MPPVVAGIRERMLRALCGLPDRTPLNARPIGVLDFDGYKVEKVMFEGQLHSTSPGTCTCGLGGQHGDSHAARTVFPIT